MTKEVATTKAAGVPATFDYGDAAGAGFEGTTSKDLSIPFIAVLQSNSPQVEDKLVDGAESGMLFNSVTQELTKGDVGIPFIPVHYEEAYVEWVPRTKGGGFVAVHAMDSEIVKKVLASYGGKKPRERVTLPNTNELIETAYVYGLTTDAEGSTITGFAVVSFTSTKLKPYRDWKTQMYLLTGKPPLYANRAVLKTVKQKNEKGTYYNYAIKPLKGDWRVSLINPAVEAELLVAAKNFRESVVSGAAKADFNQQNVAGGAANDGQTGDDAPF